MSRLVVDTNVLVSSLLGVGPPRQIVNRIRDGQDLLCLSPPIVAEYLNVLQRAGVAATLLLSLLELLRDPEPTVFVAPASTLDLIRADPDDNKFLECAVAALADLIVSGDHHLRRVKAFRGIPISSPREYLASLADP